MFKHVNGDFAGDRRVEWQADQRVPHSRNRRNRIPVGVLGSRSPGHLRRLCPGLRSFGSFRLGEDLADVLERSSNPF